MWVWKEPEVWKHGLVRSITLRFYSGFLWKEFGVQFWALVCMGIIHGQNQKLQGLIKICQSHTLRLAAEEICCIPWYYSMSEELVFSVCNRVKTSFYLQWKGLRLGQGNLKTLKIELKHIHSTCNPRLLRTFARHLNIYQYILKLMNPSMHSSICWEL